MSYIAHDSCLLPVFACFSLSGLFVGSLYIWNSKHDRNHPSTIKQRFCSVFATVLIFPFILKYFITSAHFKKFTILELIGIRLPGLVPAAVLPLFLTIVLFLGPIMQDIIIIWRSFININFWLNNVTNLIWLRNIIIGPLSEEFTFRACMLPLLLQCLEPLPAVFICSFIFGLAHVHHVVERYKAGDPYVVLCLNAIVQFSYTTLFGAYSAFVFLKTGHFIAPFLIHAFCNAMAFPDFIRVFSYEKPKKYTLIFLYVLGVTLWCLLFSPILNHTLYKNYVYFGDSMT